MDVIGSKQYFNFLLYVLGLCWLISLPSCGQDKFNHYSPVEREVVVFSEQSDFGSDFTTHYYSFTLTGKFVYAKYNSDGSITSLKSLYSRTLPFPASSLLACNSENYSQEQNLVSDVQGASVELIQLSENSVLSHQICLDDIDLQTKWLNNNPEIKKILSEAKDLPKGQYAQISPYWGKGKPDYEIETHANDLQVQLLLQSPYQFWHHTEFTQNSLSIGDPGRVYLVRHGSYLYAITWYKF